MFAVRAQKGVADEEDFIDESALNGDGGAASIGTLSAGRAAGGGSGSGTGGLAAGGRLGRTGAPEPGEECWCIEALLCL